jgi:hypothetical protein
VSGSTKCKEGLDCAAAMERIPMDGTDDKCLGFPTLPTVVLLFSPLVNINQSKCLLPEVISIKICVNRKAEKTEEYTGIL